MKKIIVSLVFVCLFVMGYAKVSRADSWTTFRSSSVLISSASSLELLSISIASGTGSWGEAFVVVIDTLPRRVGTTGGGRILAGGNANFDEGSYPVAQWVCPPIIAFTSYTVSGSLPAVNTGGVNTVTFGSPVPIKNGLVVFNVGKDGLPVTVRYRRKP